MQGGFLCATVISMNSIYRIYTNKIVVHHSVTGQKLDKDKTMQSILNGHKASGLAYDGQNAYHWVIGHDWETSARTLATVGYHSGNWWTNFTSVGICLVGNFNEDTPTEYQKDRLGIKLGEWMEKYGIKTEGLKLHRNIVATACPGRNIDLPLLYSLVDNKVPVQIIQSEFLRIWNTIPAPGDWQYFMKRLEKKTIVNLRDMLVKMEYWHSIVYPKGVYSKDGDDKWQEEKRKVFKNV